MASTYVTKRANDLNKPIFDATKHRTVVVSSNDVAKSQLKNSKACAFARACEHQKGVEAAFFFKSYAYIETPRAFIRYKLPESMRKEIVAFDRNRTMEPGEYTLSPIPKSARLDSKRMSNDRHNNKRRSHKEEGRGKGKNYPRHVTTNVRGLFDPSYRAAKD